MKRILVRSHQEAHSQHSVPYGGGADGKTGENPASKSQGAGNAFDAFQRIFRTHANAIRTHFERISFRRVQRGGFHVFDASTRTVPTGCSGPLTDPTGPTHASHISSKSLDFFEKQKKHSCQEQQEHGDQAEAQHLQSLLQYANLTRKSAPPLGT